MIDYGRGQTNIDHETGIRYGVIPSHVLGQWWYDGAEGDYGEPLCPECGDGVVEYDEEKHEGFKGSDGYADYACESCQLVYGTDMVWPDTPVAWVYENDEYAMEQGGDDSDVFVTRSPYYTWCEYCSPCAPGAGYLLSQMAPESGIRAYCPGPDWFEDDPPIAIYSIETEAL
jgi:hypothetical protein